MSLTRCALLLVMFFAAAAVCLGQTAGQVFGRAVDASGAVLPGVTVTLSSEALLEPRTAVTSETGTYLFSGLPIGLYSIKFELAGFGTQVRDGARLTAGASVQVNGALEVAGLVEDIVVTGVSPIVDIRSATQGENFSAETLQAIPTARDVFHVLSQTAGIAIDRQNVGGSLNGQQTGMFSRGAANGQGRWFVDGVDRNDLSNGRPFTVDYNSVEEMQISTGGADVTMQTPGVMVNIITKSGSDTFRGSASAFITDDALMSVNVTDESRRQGASSGLPLVNAKDYGAQIGGPIVSKRVWFWGTYSMQRAQLGAPNYYKKTAACAPIAASPLSYPYKDYVDCLNVNVQEVPALGSKINARPFAGNLLTASNSFGQRVEKIRGVSDLVSFAASNQLTFVKRGDSAQDLGVKYWNHGIWDPSWRFADQQTFSDRWIMDVSFGHHCFCNTITPQEESKGLQHMLETSTGQQERAHVSSRIEWRLNNTLEVTSSYFLPGGGGDHSFKVGYKYGRYRSLIDTVWNGDAQAIFNSPPPAQPFSNPFTARIQRSIGDDKFLYQHSAYLQDTYAVNRLTFILGLRWDRQDDEVPEINAVEHPFQGQITRNGTPFNLFPALTVPAVSSGVVWNTLAPRLGVTYDLTGDATNVVKASYALYFDQRANGALASALNPIGAARIDLGWTDLNGDQTVQAREVDTSVIRSVTGFNPDNPSAIATNTNQVDPNIKGPRTAEIVVGYSREMGGIGINVNYVRRAYSNFIWQDLFGISAANYSPVTFAPPPASCPAGARCETVTYFVPNVPLPTDFVLTNQPDYRRAYNGVELVVRKRSSRGWMLNGSLAYGSTVQHYDSPAAYEDPTNIATLNGGEFAPTTGIGNGGANVLAGVPISAKWIARMNGSYTLPWSGISAAATIDFRQGYPFIQGINIASRPNRAAAVAVLLDPVGDVRLPAFKNLDLHVDRAVRLGKITLLPALDMFNVFNTDIVLGRRTSQNAANANQIFGIVGPRTLRMGVTATF